MQNLHSTCTDTDQSISAKTNRDTSISISTRSMSTSWERTFFQIINMLVLAYIKS